MRCRGALALLFSVGLGGSALTACSSESPPRVSPEPLGSSESAVTIGGCTCPQTGTCSDVSYSDIPGDGSYYITTFGGGADTQGMACGGTADGTWAYVADEARYGCGAKLLVEGNGKSCVAQVSDCGPNQCVEQAAAYDNCTGHHPILDASPFITEYLFGISGSGWSDQRSVHVTLLGDNATVGCPGSAPPPPPSDAGTDAAVDASRPPPPGDAGEPPREAGGDDGGSRRTPPRSPPPQGQAGSADGNAAPGSGATDTGSGCSLARTRERGPGGAIVGFALAMGLLATRRVRRGPLVQACRVRHAPRPFRLEER